MDRKTAIKKISDKFSIPENEIIKLLEGVSAPQKSNLSTSPERAKKTTTTQKAGAKAEHHASPIRKKFFFLADDYLLFLKKMENVLTEIQRIGDEVGESCAESESYHDNFCYEEGSRQQGLWKNHLKYLQRIKERAEVLSLKKIEDCVNIGSKVELETENGEIISKKIGSYITFSDNDISYESPLAKSIIGKKTGDRIRGEIDKKNVYFKIKKII